MKIGHFISTFFLVVAAASSHAASTRQIFTVNEVGISSNTNTIFVITEEEAHSTICDEKRYFRMELPAPEAFMVYSAALNAMNESKRIRLQYTTDACLNGSPAIEVFWNLNS